MQNRLDIALIQTDLIWEDPEANRKLLENKILSVPDTVDLIVLPEMFTSGFTMNANLVAEPMNGITIKWLKKLANTTNAGIAGSLVISEHNNYYNRFVFVHPTGEMNTYDKRHTFTLAGEHKVYTSGKSKTIINYRGWKICPLICYDLRFPVWARNTENYDLLIYVANWPKPRISAWDALLKARAIENMSYCVGVNRIGLDGTNHEYPGHSSVYDVLGEKLLHIESNKEVVTTVTVEKAILEKYRTKLNFLKDRDEFLIV